MEITAQIIATVAICIVGSSLLIFILRHIYHTLSQKLDKEIFEETVHRLEDHLESGNQRFDKIDSSLEKTTNAINKLNISCEGLQITLRNTMGK